MLNDVRVPTVMGSKSDLEVLSEAANVLLPRTCTLVSITESGCDTLELRCLADAEGSGGLRWTMSRDHAQDVARWWSTEDMLVKSGQQPVRDKDCGNVLVSMFTPSMVHVRVRDRLGRIEAVGYSFPRAVLEHLDRWAAQPPVDDCNPNRPEGN